VSERADVACCGVTVAQAAALEALDSEGPMRLGDLGRRLGIAPSTLTRNLERLESSGLVIREPDVDDARSARVRLASSGRRAAAAVAAQEEDFARQVLEHIPAHRRGLVVAALGDLLAAVRAATEECCPGAFDHLTAGFAAARLAAGGQEAAGGEGRAAGPGSGGSATRVALPAAACGCGPARAKGRRVKARTGA
jgi:DNA-binding MarR family transcriptional regulator